LQIAGVPLRALLGYPVVMELAVPLGPAYAGLGLWLIVKGFGERREAALDLWVDPSPNQCHPDLSASGWSPHAHLPNR
jgi:hypothetical protein